MRYAIFLSCILTQFLLISGALTRFELKPTDKTVVIDCQSEELEKVTLENVQEISDLLIKGCVPRTSYIDFFNLHNITLDNNLSIRIHNLPTPLKSTHLKNIPLHFFELKNVTLDNDFIDHTAKIDTLIIDGAILPTLPENNEIKNIALKNGESLSDFGGCKSLLFLDILKWKIPKGKGWLAKCKNLFGVSVNEIKEEDVKVVLDGVTTLKLFEAADCGLNSIPTELLSNNKLTQIGLGKNKLVKIGDAIKSLQWLKSIVISEENLDLEDFAKGLESLKNLIHIDVLNYHGCPKFPQVKASSNATEVRIGDTVELSCWIETPCLHVLQWHFMAQNQLLPFYWSAIEDGSVTFLTASSQTKMTTNLTIKDKNATVLLCRGLFPGKVKDAAADTIVLKIVD